MRSTRLPPIFCGEMLSDVAYWSGIGGSAALLALTATVADRRRVNRQNLDAVGFMPWTGLFFVALLVACVTLGLAARAWVLG